MAGARTRGNQGLLRQLKRPGGLLFALLPPLVFVLTPTHAFTREGPAIAAATASTLTTAAADSKGKQSELAIDPLTVVQRRINAFNRHALEDYLAAHHRDVAIYRFPDHLLGTGHEHLRWIFGPALAKGLGKLSVEHQTVIGNQVVSEERLKIGEAPEEHFVTIYTIIDGAIAAMRLVEHKP